MKPRTGCRIRKPVQMRICRELEGAACQSVATIFAAPGKPAEYTDTLPATLTTGALHAMTYQILAINKHGRSAGPSNAAETLAGEAPPPIQDFSAAMAERGVILRWHAIPDLPPGTSIQLQRKLLTPPAAAANNRAAGALPPISEPEQQTLQVPPVSGRTDPGIALDTSVIFNRKYQYVATRTTQRKIGTQSIQVASAPSNPIVIVTRDTFPPASPSGLAAVPVPASLNNGTPEVDLSWSANTEPDLAQYFVYRRDVASHEPAQQIAPEDAAAPVVAPAFQDHACPAWPYVRILRCRGRQRRKQKSRFRGSRCHCPGIMNTAGSIMACRGSPVSLRRAAWNSP